MAARRFFPVEVRAVTEQTADAVCVEFAAPGGFQFRAGQYVNVKANIDGREVRRSYSVCEAEGGALRVLVKQIENGVFSKYARTRLRPGDTLQLMPPMGNFADGVAYNAKTRLCGVAAGSGITPVISVVETALAAGGEASLIYGSRDHKNVIFRERLAEMKDRYLSRFALFHILSRENTEAPLFCGRLDGEKLKQLFALCLPRPTNILLCGPAEMMDAAQQAAREQFPGAKTHRELFNAPKVSPPPRRQESANAGDVDAHIRLDGVRRHIAMRGDETILQAALRAGLETPYSCAGGVCGTCRARLIKGKVTMAARYALEEERQEDVILSCQAYPVGGEIEISFDI